MSREINKNEEITLKILGKNLRFIRKNLLNLTLHQMVELTGVSRDVLCRVEDMANGLNGKKAYPSIYTIIKIASGLGVKPSFLLDCDISMSDKCQSVVLNSCKSVDTTKNLIAI